MCGITCAVALRGHGPLLAGDSAALSTTLEKSLDTIKHRGPDANGHWISEDCRVGMSFFGVVEDRAMSCLLEVGY